MAILLFLVGISVAALLLIALIDWRWGSHGVCWLTLVVAILAFLLFVPFFFIQFAGAFVLGLACVFFQAPRGAATCCALVPTALALWLGGGIAVARWEKTQEIVRKAPLISLEERLAYESKPNLSHSLAPLAAAVEERLAKREDRDGRWVGTEQDAEQLQQAQWREMQLARVHAGAESEFVRAMGFGVERLNPLQRPFVELPPEKSIPLPSPEEDQGTPSIRPPEATAPMQALPVPDSGVLTTLHFQGERDFLSRQRTGFVRGRREVAGFQPHQFARIPELPRERWQVTRLELVSLLKHERPVVYVSKNLPNMGELTAVPTRTLNDFEQRALARLRSEEDVVTEESPDRIEMLGSLRAAKDCRQCHEVERGELLGALSYVLKRANRAAKPAPKPNDSALIGYGVR